jgi:hypothetical protein
VSALAPTQDLGGGVTVAWVWNSDAQIPCGVVVAHLADGQECAAFLAWAHEDPAHAELWQLVSLVPLHLEPSLTCPRCGLSGTIRDGHWAEAA